MTDCTRFEQEGLAALVKGEPLDEHFSNCDTCIEEHRKYRELLNLLASVDEDAAPANDWQAQVLERIKRDTAQEQKPMRWYGSIAAGFAALLIASVLLLQPGEQSGINGELAVVVDAGSTVYRGSDAKINDTLSLSSQVDPDGYAEIRVYRDGRLYYACVAGIDCKGDSKAISADITLASVGEYQAVLLQNNSKLLLTDKRLDADLLSARDQGATVTMRKTVLVQ